jgi:hypothetical protein
MARTASAPTPEGRHAIEATGAHDPGEDMNRKEGGDVVAAPDFVPDCRGGELRSNCADSE